MEDEDQLFFREADEIERDAQKGARRSNKYWSEKYLKNMFSNGMRDHSRNVILLIDGLDEYEGDTLDLLQLLQSLSSINVCLPSRPEPLIGHVLREQPGLGMEN